VHALSRLQTRRQVSQRISHDQDTSHQGVSRQVSHPQHRGDPGSARGREVEVVGTAVAEVEAGSSEVATAVSNDLVPYLLSRIFRWVGGGNFNPVPWDLDNPASRLPQSVSSVLRRLSSCFLSFVYIDINCLFQSPNSCFRSNLRVRIIRLRCATPYDSVSEGLPSSEYGRGVLLSTLHYDSEACVKRH